MIKVLDEVIEAAGGLAACGVVICVFLYIGWPIDMATGVFFFLVGIIAHIAATAIKVGVEMRRQKRRLPE